MTPTQSTTRVSVLVIEDVALPQRPYRIAFELDKKVVPPLAAASAPPALTPVAEFAVAHAGTGRLTIEKERPLDADGEFPLEDSYEFSVQLSGKHPLLFRFITAQPTRFPCPKAGATSPTSGVGAKVRDVAGLPRGVTLEKGNDNGWTVKLTIADPADAPSAMRKIGPTGAARWHPAAHVIRGVNPARRTLIVSGVHPSEPEGIRVVNELLELFRKRGPAGVTAVVVPVLIPRASRGPDTAGARYIPSEDNGKRSIEPNRNFPMPGHSYAMARELGLWYPGEAELLFCQAPAAAKTKGKPEAQEYAAPPQKPKGAKDDYTSKRLMPETALLIALIEELKPESIISIHAHQQIVDFLKGIGNNAGIFVDPRLGFEKVDDALALAMVESFDVKYEHAKRKYAMARAGSAPLLKTSALEPDFSWDPLRGNRSVTPGSSATRPVLLPATNLRYAAPDKVGANPGTSLGEWGPREVVETFAGVSSPRGNRPGIPVVTVECPLADEGKRRLSVQAAAQGVPAAPVDVDQRKRISVADSKIIESIHAEVIYEVALEGPDTP